MVHKLIKIGNSKGVTIPNNLIEIFDLKLGEELFFEADLKNGGIIIKPLIVAKSEVNEKVIEGMAKFIKRYPKALKNLAKKTSLKVMGKNSALLKSLANK